MKVFCVICGEKKSRKGSRGSAWVKVDKNYKPIRDSKKWWHYTCKECNKELREMFKSEEYQRTKKGMS